jgi:hypothetical protein
MSQSTDVPSGYGFAKSLKLDCTTADASPSAGDFFWVRQLFEGQNLQYLKKGTGSAVSLTASFWVKSTKTGTFIVQLVDDDNTRSISNTYTVSVSNTWEFKTVTFAGDTTGAFDNDNASSLQLRFWIGAGTTYTSGTLQTSWGTQTNADMAVGQVNCADSTSNDFLITGVQLEAGTSATDFEFLPIDVSLGRCERYFRVCIGGVGVASTNTTSIACALFHLNMRTTPSYSIAQANTQFTDFYASNPQASGNSVSINGADKNFANLNFTGFTSLTGARLYHLSTTTTPVLASAEL